jgi:hypothetical protein
MSIQTTKRSVYDYFEGTAWAEKKYDHDMSGLYILNDHASVAIVVTAAGFTMTVPAGKPLPNMDFYPFDSVVVEPADGTKQVETIQVTHAADAAGTLSVSLTSVTLAEPVLFDVVVALGDSVNVVAGKIRTAAAATAAIAAVATISGATDAIIATMRAAAANDATLAWALEDADSTGVTVGASGDTTGGIAPSAISFRAWVRD